MDVKKLRRALWHFRHGGIAQLNRFLEFEERKRLEQSTDEADARRLLQIERVERRGFDPLDFAEYTPNPQWKKPYGHIKVGVILDDFSHLAWGEEFTTVSLLPDTWREELDRSFDFLLVESAWQGNGAAWRYQVVGSQAPSQGLKDLVAECKARGIPTVFWNKEDPVHYEDFIGSAQLFDYVFTTDANLVETYRAEIPQATIGVLPFAVQPAIHNPIRDADRSKYGLGSVCFAGTYFRDKFPERARDQKLILDGAIQACESLRSSLTIYSRNEDVDEKYRFPEPYADWVVGALPYSTMLTAYRAFKVFLNVNTVTTSPTMFSRRVLELAACGANVISTPAKGIEEFFPRGELTTVAEHSQIPAIIEATVRSKLSRERQVHRAQRVLWDGHTYTHRAAAILEALDLDASARQVDPVLVSAIVSTNRPERLEGVLETICSQREVDLEILVLTHGFKAEDVIDPPDFPTVQFLTASAEVSLGACLNQLVEAARGQVIAKMDDDDCYGPDYLHDQLNALRFSGADVVGKQAAYLYLESSNELVLRKEWNEHSWVNLVLGATLVGWKNTFSEHPFAEVGRGEDTRFLQSLAAEGAKIYSADRFNYIQYRNAGSHTWDIDDSALKRSGRVVSYGCNLEHVYVEDQ